jgi:drug/metabolite transporter (DMT)-like permease
MFEKIRKNGLLSMLVACFFFSIMGLCVKKLSAQLPTTHLLFFRGVGWLLFTLPFIRKTDLIFEPKIIGMLLFRGFIGLIGIASTYFAISKLPLSTASVLANTYPIFVACLAPLFLMERVNRQLLVVGALGFTGVLLILHPSNTRNVVGSLAGLAGGLFAAIAHIMVSKLSKYVSSKFIVLVFAAITVLATAPFFLHHPIVPTNPLGWLLVAVIGITSGIAQLLMTHSYRIEAANRVSMISYFSVLFAMIWDMLLWQHLPDMMTIVGSILIICGGWLLRCGSCGS